MCPFVCPARGGGDRGQAVEPSHGPPEVGRRQAGVAEGHGQGGMSGQLLQLGQGHSPHRGTARKGVPEVVEREDPAVVARSQERLVSLGRR
jgi:hypothetical protein